MPHPHVSVRCQWYYSIPRCMGLRIDEPTSIASLKHRAEQYCTSPPFLSILDKTKKPYCKNVYLKTSSAVRLSFLSCLTLRSFDLYRSTGVYPPLKADHKGRRYNKDPITLRPMIAHGLPLSLCFILSNF
jgi:hypothetical protein